MFPCAGFGFGFWWLFPIVMIAMMALFFFMIRRHGGPMMCMPGAHRRDSHGEDAPETALDVLNKRYARGELNKDEYEEKKRGVTRQEV